ncbi:hypothetical protein U1Q18_003317, partial [Sarracenia purpurea var. burkii]
GFSSSEITNWLYSPPDKKSKSSAASAQRIDSKLSEKGMNKGTGESSNGDVKYVEPKPEVPLVEFRSDAILGDTWEPLKSDCPSVIEETNLEGDGVTEGERSEGEVSAKQTMFLTSPIVPIEVRKFESGSNDGRVSDKEVSSEGELQVHEEQSYAGEIIAKGEAEAGATNDEVDSKDVASDEAKSGSSEQDVLDASSSDEDRTTRAIDVQVFKVSPPVGCISPGENTDDNSKMRFLGDKGNQSVETKESISAEHKVFAKLSKPNSVTLSGGLKSADEESVLGNELGVEEEDVLCEGSENSGTGLVYKETGVLSEVNEGHYPKAILLVEDRMNIDKVNLLDLRLSCAGYFPMDDALDCRPVSANRDLQIDARSCIVSGAHDLLVKMPKQELMSKVSATIPGAGKQGQIDELMPKGMSGGSLGTTEGMPSDHQRLDEIPDPFLAADIVSSVPKFKRAGSGSQDQGIERDPKTWASVVASHGMSSPITGGLRLNHRSFSDEWVRVKRKRDRKKIKRREESKYQERTKSMKTSLQPVAGGDKSMPRQGNEQYRAQGPVRVQPMLRHLPFGHAPGVQLADVVGYSAPPLSLAARASLLVNAIDGSGKMMKRC